MLSSRREISLLLPLPLTSLAPGAPIELESISQSSGFGRGMSQARVYKENSGDQRRSAMMAAAQAGDRRAYDALLRDCVPIVRMVARRQRVPDDQIDDVVQEVLLSVHHARHTYDPTRSFTAWLQVIAERRAIDHLRRSGRRRLREVHAPLGYENYVDPSADPSRGVQQADGTRQANRVIAELPERQREAVNHLVLGDQSLAQAAAATGRTEGALKVNLHRALKALRTKLTRSE
jgi:RNA polymerase sigma factor (sigma-70 family)